MVELLIAMLLVFFVFDGAFRLSRKLLAKTVLDHAAARAARARSVGFNDFMCRKAARASMIPVAGKRLWPQYGGYDEVARIPAYMASKTAGEAAGILEYAGWHSSRVDVKSGHGVSPEAEASIVLSDPDFRITGRSKVESHFPLYMDDAGR